MRILGHSLTLPPWTAPAVVLPEEIAPLREGCACNCPDYFYLLLYIFHLFFILLVLFFCVFCFVLTHYISLRHVAGDHKPNSPSPSINKASDEHSKPRLISYVDVSICWVTPKVSRLLASSFSTFRPLAEHPFAPMAILDVPAPLSIFTISVNPSYNISSLYSTVMHSPVPPLTLFIR